MSKMPIAGPAILRVQRAATAQHGCVQSAGRTPSRQERVWSKPCTFTGGCVWQRVPLASMETYINVCLVTRLVNIAADR